MHTRIVVVSKDIHYPNKIVPSTGNVGDVETPHLLVEEDHVTNLMDRGYPSIKNLMTWQEKEFLFYCLSRIWLGVNPAITNKKSEETMAVFKINNIHVQAI